MKRRGWIFLGVALLACGGLAALLRPRGPERFPLSELVPADAVFYAGFPDYREIEGFQTPWSKEIRERLEPARPHLSGALAVYLDREFRWVALARLTRASALIAGAETEAGAAVIAQTPEAMAKHKAREAALADLPEFKSLGARFFINLEPLRLRGRFRDFSAIGFSADPGPPFVLRGRALYRGSSFRTYLGQYVQAPRHGAAEGDAPARVALTEHFPRVWEEIVHELDTIDCEKAEREAALLSRDFLDGRPFREFLARLGPTWGFSIVPTPYSRPALVVWIDLPDEQTRDLAAKMVHRAISDAVRIRRERGAAPAFEVAADGPIWRVKWIDSKTLRLGESYSPAYVFEKNRFVFSTCASTLSAPSVSTGDAHGTATVEVAALLDAIRAMAPQFADDAFRGSAERNALALYLRTFTGGAMAALRKRFADPSELAKYLDMQKALFEVRALEDASKTEDYQKELARVRASIESGAEKVSWLERASWTGRFTAEGLDFELRAWPAPKR